VSLIQELGNNLFKKRNLQKHRSNKFGITSEDIQLLNQVSLASQLISNEYLAGKYVEKEELAKNLGCAILVRSSRMPLSTQVVSNRNLLGMKILQVNRFRKRSLGKSDDRRKSLLSVPECPRNYLCFLSSTK
jgi:hypothetical protein